MTESQDSSNASTRGAEKAFTPFGKVQAKERTAAHSPMSDKGTKARRDKETRDKGEFLNRTNAMHPYQLLMT